MLILDCYKIMEVSDNSFFVRTLFHGTDGTRSIELGRWYKAQIREEAKDGSSQKTYRSGFHVIDTLRDTLVYLKRFRKLDRLCIVKCSAMGISRKDHSPAAGLYLADHCYFDRIILSPADLITYIEIPIERGDK